MRRAMAMAWLVVVVLLGLHLVWRIHQGLVFRTDLMALLPRDEANPALQQVNDRVAQSLSRRVAVLVGDPDRGRARLAATTMSRALTDTALVEVLALPASVNQLAALAALYFPYRAGLLAEDDTGELSFQGTRYKGFNRNLAAPLFGGATTTAAPEPPANAAGFCPYCGVPVRAGFRFCPQCGQPQPETAAPS